MPLFSEITRFIASFFHPNRYDPPPPHSEPPMETIGAEEASASSFSEYRDAYVISRESLLRDAFGPYRTTSSDWSRQSPLLFSPFGLILSLQGCGVLMNQVLGMPAPRTAQGALFGIDSPEPPPPPGHIQICARDYPQLGTCDLEISQGMQIRTHHSIEFYADTADLTDDSAPILNAVADFLIRHPEIRHILITGYAGNVGNMETSVRLASQRALVVKQYLIERGVAQDRISTWGLLRNSPTFGRLVHIEITEVRP